MRRVTLRGLRARKLRTALTAFAIVLGVAMVTGSSVLGATMKRSFDIVFSSAYEQTDVVVSGKPVVDWSESSAPTLPVSMLDEIRATPGVARAAGAIFDFSGNSPYAIVIAPNGKKISGDPSFVMGFKPEDEQFNPLRLREGRWAAGDGEVVLDASTADGHGVKVGDTVKVAALTPSAPFKVVGIGRFGKVSSLGGATMTVFDVPVAQRLLQKDGKLDVVSVAAADGVTPEALAQRLQPFASSTVQVQTADERAADDQAGIGLFVDIITWILRGFGGVVLFVGGFVIINTLSITVAQRTRELGTLRLIGATRSQVRRAVVLESLLIGILASLVGVAVGVALAVGLRALLGAFDFSFPATALVISPQTLAVGFLIGVIVTVIAGLLPAARATRISPVEAVREGATHAARQDGASRKRARNDPVRRRDRPARARDVEGRQPRRRRDARVLARRDAAPVHRRRDARADRSAGDRADRRVAGGPLRRDPGAPRSRQRDPQSGPHRIDRGGADDRHRPRLRNRGARSEPQGHRGRGRRVADRLLARAPVGDRAGSRCPRRRRRRSPARPA